MAASTGPLQLGMRGSTFDATSSGSSTMSRLLGRPCRILDGSMPPSPCSSLSFADSRFAARCLASRHGAHGRRHTHAVDLQRVGVSSLALSAQCPARRSSGPLALPRVLEFPIKYASFSGTIGESQATIVERSSPCAATWATCRRWHNCESLSKISVGRFLVVDARC